MISRHHFDGLQNAAHKALRGLLLISLVAMPLGGCAYTVYIEQDPLFEGVAPEYPFGLTDLDATYIGQELYNEIEKQIINQSSRPINRQKPLRIITSFEGFTTGFPGLGKDLKANSSFLISTLQQVSEGKLAFLDRNRLDVILRERGLKRQGAADRGTLGLAAKIAGADYMLFFDNIDSEISTSRGLDALHGVLTLLTAFVLAPITFPIIAYNDLGLVSTRTLSVSFSLVDIETGAIFYINKQVTKKRSSA